MFKRILIDFEIDHFSFLFHKFLIKMMGQLLLEYSIAPKN